MKKIGILTYHNPESRNYGAILQAYATMKFLKKMGKDVKIINYKKIDKEKRELLKKESVNFQKFADNFLDLTEIYEYKKDLKKLNEKFDIFIVGSDQVWRVGKLRFSPEYFLDFVHNSKVKISYAASFGLDKWNGNFIYTFLAKKLIKKFNYISVRERSGEKICEDIFGVNSKCVLDPTLILEKSDYQEILDLYINKENTEKKYIAQMILDDSEKIKSEINNISKKMKYEIKHIKGEKNKEGLFEFNKVEEWLAYIKNAELVITDSFHCVAFSLIFNKKFVVVANPGRGKARLENILEIVGLKERFFENIDEVLKSNILNKEINYNEVEKKLNIEKKYSIDFLRKALGEENE